MKKTILTLGIILGGVTASFGQQNEFYTNLGPGNGFKLTNSDHYKLSLGYNGYDGNNKYYYGPVQNWAIKMSNYPHPTLKRGWVWGVSTPGVDPIAALNIFGDMQIKKDFVAEGSMAIGTTIHPDFRLHVNGKAKFTVNNSELDILQWGLAGPLGMTIRSQDINGGSLSLAFTAKNFYFHSGGVGIGTNKVAGYKLSVEGKMRAREIEVNALTWADFVFADDYQLSSLYEVENYIKENNHLPNVPSEKEVAKDGINLGEMDAILLRKIEELTLYIIEQDKRIKDLEKQ